MLEGSQEGSPAGAGAGAGAGAATSIAVAAAGGGGGSVAKAESGSAVLSADELDSYSLTEVNVLLGKLSKRKRALQRDMELLDYQLCHEFLTQVKADKEKQLAEIGKELGLLDADLTTLEGGVVVQLDVKPEPSSGKRKRGAPPSKDGSTGGSSAATSVADAKKSTGSMFVRASSWEDEQDYAIAAASAVSARGGAGGTGVGGTGRGSSSDPRCGGGGGGSPSTEEGASAAAVDTELPRRRRRMQEHHRDLEAAYFDTHGQHEGKEPSAALKQFQHNVSRFTRYSQFTIFAQLSYNQHNSASSSIVSSIEFDKHDDNFATAGVTKEIKIYEYKTIVEQSNIETHCPVRNMQCRSKISCLSWNPYFKEWIASSDYEGVVSCWNAYTGQKITQFEEHEKRAWSVDFCETMPKMLASGSDDSKVKIWDVDTPRKSVSTIQSKANVCCVKFNPESSNYIAFGSADHHIHYYDLRSLKKEVFVFKGHAKAVSYVRFLSADELVSASTDSTLKLWSTSENECKRTFTGHTNEKNFVGLSVCDDYIACGSENNAVYTYYKSLPRPVVEHQFSRNKKGGRQADETNTDFVSSVCWKKNSNVLLAANSQGTINIMNLSK